MKLADIVIGEQYEEKWSDKPITVLDIRENPASRKREVWIKNFRGEERFTTPVRIERLWRYVELERATIEWAEELAVRLKAVGLPGKAEGKYGYGVPGWIALNAITSDEAEDLLARLEVQR